MSGSKVDNPQPKPITLSLPFGMGRVHCYLIETKGGYVLIDTGLAWQRRALEKELMSAGCKPGNLGLIVLTHGDVDHSGNGAYLREKYGAKIAIHPADSIVVERGDMTLSRTHTPFLARTTLGLVRLSKSDRFKPDILVEDGQDLSEHGLDARVVHTPGHSIGSIGIVMNGSVDSAASKQVPNSPGSGTALFCGDLLVNTNKPGLNSIMDDLDAANASVKKLSGLGIKTVYPGHGDPFLMDEL